MVKLALLPGWGLGLEPLQALVRQLSARHETALYPLPALTLAAALEQLDRQIPQDSWLLGWSLGGMLAVALAAKRAGRCPGVITLGSNASFVARENWPQAMPAPVFSRFQRHARSDRDATMRAFRQLCTHGDPSATLPAIEETSAAEHLPGLDWLAQLDNRAAIACLDCPQLHVLAAADALVPAAVATALAQLNPRAEVKTLPGSHAFVVSHSAEVAQELLRFVGRHCAGAGSDD